MPDAQTYAADCATLREMVRSAYTSNGGEPELIPKVVCGDWSCEDEPNDATESAGQWWKMVDDFNMAATTPQNGDPHGSVDALSLHWCAFLLTQ